MLGFLHIDALRVILATMTPLAKSSRTVSSRARGPRLSRILKCARINEGLKVGSSIADFSTNFHKTGTVRAITRAPFGERVWFDVE